MEGLPELRWKVTQRCSVIKVREGVGERHVSAARLVVTFPPDIRLISRSHLLHSPGGWELVQPLWKTSGKTFEDRELEVP